MPAIAALPPEQHHKRIHVISTDEEIVGGSRGSNLSVASTPRNLVA